MEDVIIEPESPENRDRISTVVRQAFEPQPAVAEMVAAIRRSPRYRPGLALVAHSGGEPVGFVMLSGTDLVDQNGDRREVLTLTPLAVAPDHQHRGIGSALVRAALQAADRLGEPLVVLEGSPGYYGRLGFRFAGDHGITIDLPDWAPREAAQVFLLPAYDPALQVMSNTRPRSPIWGADRQRHCAPKRLVRERPDRSSRYVGSTGHEGAGVTSVRRGRTSRPAA